MFFLVDKNQGFYDIGILSFMDTPQRIMLVLERSEPIFMVKNHSVRLENIFCISKTQQKLLIAFRTAVINSFNCTKQWISMS